MSRHHHATASESELLLQQLADNGWGCLIIGAITLVGDFLAYHLSVRAEAVTSFAAGSLAGYGVVFVDALLHPRFMLLASPYGPGPSREHPAIRRLTAYIGAQRRRSWIVIVSAPYLIAVLALLLQNHDFSLINGIVVFYAVLASLCVAVCLFHGVEMLQVRYWPREGKDARL